MNRKWIWTMAITFALVAGYIEYRENRDVPQPEDYGVLYGSCDVCGELVYKNDNGLYLQGGDKQSDYHSFFVHTGRCMDERQEKQINKMIQEEERRYNRFYNN